MMETGGLHISVARARVTSLVGAPIDSASVLVNVADSDACGLVACTASALLILCAQVESGVRQVAWSEAWQQAEAGLDEQLLSISTELRDKEVSEGAAQREGMEGSSTATGTLGCVP